MSNEGGGDFHGSWAFDWSTEMIVRLGGLIVRKGCGEFRPVRDGEGALARLRGGTGWRWRGQLNVHAIALLGMGAPIATGMGSF